MNKYEYYVAYDGKSFDCRSDCEDYELNKLKECIDKKEIRFLNENLNDHEDSREKPMMALEESAAIYIKNVKAYKILLAVADYYGVSVPEGAGFWYHDDYHGCWGKWSKLWLVLEKEKQAIDEKMDKYNKIIQEA